MKKNRSWWRVIITWSLIVLMIIFLALIKFLWSSNDPMATYKSFIYIEPLSSYFRKSHSEWKRDWNDHELIRADNLRKGPGEHNEVVHVELSNDQEIAVAKRFGHNIFASNQIPLYRAIPDLRSDECQKYEFRAALPKVSVIIPIFDEHHTTVKRTLVTLMKRTPSQLLYEVILVSDGAAPSEFIRDLEHFIHLNKATWHKKVKLLKMNRRCGVICSRLAGARYASGDVFFFLDCHTEVGYNYLPPLLEPISYDYRHVVTPTLDIIDRETFEIHPLGEGMNVFDWNFKPQRVPLGKHYQGKTFYQTAIMTGISFAIAAKYYWELVPDSSMMVYGGDEFELSFKINLCGGKLFESACSRVAYIYRRFPYDKHMYSVDYKARNLKRIAEIWLDEFKTYIYARHPERYEKVDPGDISQQVQLRKDMKCAPMNHFFGNVAPEMLERFPFIDHAEFAHGTIRNKALDMCIQVTHRGHGRKIQLSECSHNKTHPHHQQHFLLRYYRDIQIYGKSDCLEVHATKGLTYGRCHYEQGNQYFRFDAVNSHIFWNSKYHNFCLDTDLATKSVIIATCDEFKESQKWVWGFERTAVLQKWTSYGARIIDQAEFDLLENDHHHIEKNCVENQVHDETPDEHEEEVYTKITRRGWTTKAMHSVTEAPHHGDNHQYHGQNHHGQDHHQVHYDPQHHGEVNHQYHGQEHHEPQHHGDVNHQYHGQGHHEPAHHYEAPAPSYHAPQHHENINHQQDHHYPAPQHHDNHQQYHGVPDHAPQHHENVNHQQDHHYPAPQHHENHQQYHESPHHAPTQSHVNVPHTESHPPQQNHEVHPPPHYEAVPHQQVTNSPPIHHEAPHHPPQHHEIPNQHAPPPQQHHEVNHQQQQHHQGSDHHPHQPAPHNPHHAAPPHAPTGHHQGHT